MPQTPAPQLSVSILESLSVRIARPTRKVMRLRIVGRSPLITNRFGEVAMDKMESAQAQQGKTRKSPREPERDFREACHVISGDRERGFATARFGIRAVGVKKAIVAAGNRYADGNKRELNGVIFVNGPEPGGFIEIKGPPPTMGRDYVVMRSRSGPCPNLSYRPYFNEWYADLEIIFLEPFISVSVLLTILGFAGMSVGIGSWRTENGGDKGAFDIDPKSVKVSPCEYGFGGIEVLSPSEGIKVDRQAGAGHRGGNGVSPPPPRPASAGERTAARGRKQPAV